MKLQIDTEKKTFKLESSQNLGEFIDKIQAMFPDWKEYKLETNVTINWSSAPTIIYRDRYPYWPYNSPPRIRYDLTVGSSSITDDPSILIGSSTTDTVYNAEI